jgi:hypothetical protein
VLVGAISKDENIYIDRNENSIGGAAMFIIQVIKSVGPVRAWQPLMRFPRRICPI